MQNGVTMCCAEWKKCKYSSFFADLFSYQKLQWLKTVSFSFCWSGNQLCVCLETIDSLFFGRTLFQELKKKTYTQHIHICLESEWMWKRTLVVANARSRNCHACCARPKVEFVRVVCILANKEKSKRNNQQTKMVKKNRKKNTHRV